MWLCRQLLVISCYVIFRYEVERQAFISDRQAIISENGVTHRQVAADIIKLFNNF